MSQSAKQNFCCNPYNKHGPYEKHNLRNVTQLYVERAEPLNISLEIGDKLCDSCRKDIDRGNQRKIPVSTEPIRRKVRKIEGSASDKKVSSLIGTESDTEDEDPQNKPFASASTSTSTSASTSAAAPTDMDIDEENKFEVSDFVGKWNAAFDKIEVPQIDLSKLRRKKTSTEMLNNIIKFLSMKVFVNAEKKNDGNEIIKQLKEKFEKFTSRDEQIKILQLCQSHGAQNNWQKSSMSHFIWQTKQKNW